MRGLLGLDGCSGGMCPATRWQGFLPLELRLLRTEPRNQCCKGGLVARASRLRKLRGVRVEIQICKSDRVDDRCIDLGGGIPEDFGGALESLDRLSRAPATRLARLVEARVEQNVLVNGDLAHGVSGRCPCIYGKPMYLRGTGRAGGVVATSK
jgi:hypothetical protein